MSAQRVRLSSATPPQSMETGTPLLNAFGPPRVLGGEQWQDGVPLPIQPAATTLFGPRGGCLAADGSLWICDTGHHRVLGWSSTNSSTSADRLLGQPHFEREGPNANGPLSAASLRVPTAVIPYREGLAVSDAWNNRVLIWNQLPTQTNQPADWVLGQPNFEESAPNQGDHQPSATTLHWPFGLWAEGSQLWVCDAKNRRLLGWSDVTDTGQPADWVLGQPDFVHGDENAGTAPSRASFRWPHSICRWGKRFCVADAGNNRVLIWNQMPSSSMEPCDVILGQPDEHQTEHNQSAYWPRADTLNMPYALASWGDQLLVADTANSRLLGFSASALKEGAPAQSLHGQPHFGHKGDNQWGALTLNSLCWPYGLAQQNGQLLVLDSGNNRALLWKLAQ